MNSIKFPKLPTYRSSNKTAHLARMVESAIQSQAKQEEVAGVQRAAQNPNSLTYSQSMYGTPYYMGVPGGSPYGSFAMDNPINFSTPNTPTAPPGKVINTYEMRSVARYYDIMRACISHLKREVAAVPINIVAKNKKDARASTQKQIDIANAFLRSDGGLGGYGTRRTNFEAEMLEDLLVLGCSAIQYINTKGGQVDQVVNLAAETIRPVVDGFGWPPDATDSRYDVYEQWILGLKVTGFQRTELRYDGLYPVTWSPFFDSPVEYLLANANSYIRAQGWNLAWLTDGTTNDEWIQIDRIPGVDDMTPDQVAMWVTLLSALNRGDSRQRHQMKALPPGTTLVRNERSKDWDFDKFTIYCARVCGAIYGVQLASIGFAGDQYKESQGQSIETTTIFGAGVLFDFRKGFYDDLFERMGLYDIEAVNEFIKEEDQLKKAQVQQILVNCGLRTPNELRTEDGVDAYPNGQGGDVPAMSNSMVPASMLGQDTEADRAGADDNKTVSPKPGKTADSKTDNADRSIEADLKRWCKKSYQRLRDGKTAAYNFTSESIPEPLSRMIGTMLIPCKTSDEVYRVFGLALSDVVDERDSDVTRSETALTGGEWKTVDGSHVYIKDGVAIAGNPHVLSAIEKKGMHPASDEERKLHKVRPDLNDVHVSDDPEATATYKGKDVKGKTQSPTSPAAKAIADKSKHERVKRLASKMGHISKALEHEIETNGSSKEEALVLNLLHKTGIRIGSDADTKASEKAYGGSTLEGQHVTTEGDKIHLKFIGKHGVENNVTLHDPMLAKELKSRQEHGKRLFKTNGGKTLDYLSEIGGEKFKNHDLRTLHATELAQHTIKSMPIPKTQKEFNAARKQAGETVGNRLNNGATMALNNYIDPSVFHEWEKAMGDK